MLGSKELAYSCCLRLVIVINESHAILIYKREKKLRQTFEKMEGFSFVTPVTGLNRPNTGKEDDDDILIYMG
jgi:hypothetical protein